MSGIEIIRKGVTRADADAIVNAANSGLRAGGGVCGAVFEEAGFRDMQAACDAIGHCNTGGAVITPGFALKAKYVIHAVGPIWEGGDCGEAELLASCYAAAIDLAVQNGCRSIAFPLISSGIYGYPKEEAWHVAIGACLEKLAELGGRAPSVTFCVLDESSLQLGKAVLAELEALRTNGATGRSGATTLRDVVFGAAIGDALGVPYEFRERGSFECTGMASGGSHGQPAGTFSDDTSMMIATCDSIRALGRIDCDDMRERFRAWANRGKYTPDGVMFDIGNATSTALAKGRGCTGVRSNGNGSLMRIAPLAFTDATDDEVRAVSAITHAHEISTEACVVFIRVLRKIIAGASVPEATVGVKVGHDVFDPRKPMDEVRSGGYVLDTLDASLWCLCNTGSYAECVLAAVNLGRDTDTTGCVAGALAGAAYGFDAIPTAWLATLRAKNVIEACLF